MVGCLSGWVSAIRTLTILPVPGDEAKALAHALPFFALVGGMLGAILWGLGALMGFFFDWPEAGALLVVAGGIFLTRGLHLDGLADWADGFWGGYSREKTLTIMKDPRKGTFGVLALALILLFKYVALSRLASDQSLFWLIPVMAISRTAMVWLMLRRPYARPEGGTGEAFVKGAQKRHLLVCLFTDLVFSGGFFLFGCGSHGFWALGFGLFWAEVFGWWCQRRVGGVTGDLLGACGELAEALLLFLLALRRF